MRSRSLLLALSPAQGRARSPRSTIPRVGRCGSLNQAVVAITHFNLRRMRLRASCRRRRPASSLAGAAGGDRCACRRKHVSRTAGPGRRGRASAASSRRNCRYCGACPHQTGSTRRGISPAEMGIRNRPGRAGAMSRSIWAQGASLAPLWRLTGVPHRPRATAAARCNPARFRSTRSARSPVGNRPGRRSATPASLGSSPIFRQGCRKARSPKSSGVSRAEFMASISIARRSTAPSPAAELRPARDPPSSGHIYLKRDADRRPGGSSRMLLQTVSRPISSSPTEKARANGH